MTIPKATYRIQFRKDFTFTDAAALAPYLTALGVSHLYASPYLSACAGSTHGYDVVNHRCVNCELGGEDAHKALCRALEEAGLGQVLDIVPNHMAITGRENAWWWDVLKRGARSAYAGHFDIDWTPPDPRLWNKVLLPILGDHYGRVLEDGQFKAELYEGEPIIRYYEHEAPLAPETIAVAAQAIKKEHHASKRVALLLDAADEMPEIEEADEESAAAVCHAANQDIELLDALLSLQHYRLAFWRTAATDINYRRFFEINTLIGLRMERPEVLMATHELVLKWIEEGKLHGLRIDHIDGLRYPRRYLESLREKAGDAWIIVEKILEPDEHLPTSWPVAGTTGYEWMHRLTGVLVDTAAEPAFTDFYTTFTGEFAGYDDILREKKALVIERSFSGELERLTHLLAEVCERHRRFRDYARHDLRDALKAVCVCFHSYRSYMEPGREATEQDMGFVEEAVNEARRLNNNLDSELFDFLCDILLLRISDDKAEDLALRVQQLTGPVMAKGAEDTAFYCYNRFIALNEVGADPSVFGIMPQDFHSFSEQMLASWPNAMVATSTHDTKRSEDARARLCVLSEIPEQWAAAVRRWGELNETSKEMGLPDRNAEYMIYQMLLAAWPLDKDRAIACVDKAMREAKLYTSWKDPNPIYDQAAVSFVERIFANGEFTRDFGNFITPLVTPGRINSLSQTLLKLCVPGVPDLYQGCELWDHSLMDPDNRRPVDYDLRRRLLEEVDKTSAEDAWAMQDSGMPKLFLIHHALRLRGEYPQAFGAQGGYEALEAQGEGHAHILAFVRGADVVALAPRLPLRLESNWGDTSISLPPGAWRNALTGQDFSGGEDHRVEALLGAFPVGLLHRMER